MHIGLEEWAIESQARRDRRLPRWDQLAEYIERQPPTMIAAVVLACGLPLAFSGNDYLLRIAALACLFGLLAVGLTLVAGLAGLLDLGYVGLFGVGAYTYALLASPQIGIHLPAWLSLPAAGGIAVAVALLIALPTLRLADDYLAIVTLGFGQVAVLLATRLDRIELPQGRLNLTGGPNGIVGIDAPALFGLAPANPRDWLLLLLAVLALALIIAGRLSAAPLGRAWRALRDDPVAAAANGLEVRRLRVLAVICGALFAGLTGALFAGWQQAIFPVNLDLALLLTIYAAIILGGLGSLPGAALGAVFLATLPELLRDPMIGRVLFYGGSIAALFFWRRPVLPAAGLARDHAVRAYAPRIALFVALMTLWEGRLIAEPGPTRQLLVGALLAGLMIIRPHGLFGRART